MHDVYVHMYVHAEQTLEVTECPQMPHTKDRSLLFQWIWFLPALLENLAWYRWKIRALDLQYYIYVSYMFLHKSILCGAMSQLYACCWKVWFLPSQDFKWLVSVWGGAKLLNLRRRLDEVHASRGSISRVEMVRWGSKLTSPLYSELRLMHQSVDLKPFILDDLDGVPSTWTKVSTSVLSAIVCTPHILWFTNCSSSTHSVHRTVFMMPFLIQGLCNSSRVLSHAETEQKAQLHPGFHWAF